MESEPRTDNRKAVIRIGQGQYVALLPREILETLLALQRAGLFEHGRRQIDTSDMLRDPGKSTCEKSRAARDIEYRIAGPGLGHLNDAVEGVFIANGRGGRERHRLTSELIENVFLVFRRHGLSLQFLKRFVGTQT